MEIWKEVKGYESVYEVSSKGIVRSLNHFVYHSDGKKRTQKGRVLSFLKCKKGYMRVSLSKEGKRVYHSVHRLVAEAFIPNPDNKPQVNHINGIKTDNRVENLEWCTNKENQIHAVQNNLCNHVLGENHHNSKFSNNQIQEIRTKHKDGFSNKELAKKYNISETAMSNILRNKTYVN